MEKLWNKPQMKICINKHVDLREWTKCIPVYLAFVCILANGKVKLNQFVVWQQHPSQKAESPVWMKMLRRGVKDAGILSGLVYGARSRNLWERLNFHPEQHQRSLIFYPISFSWHNASRITFCPRDLLQFLAGSHTSHFWSGAYFVISHHISRPDHIRSAYSHTSLDWYGPFPPSHGSSFCVGLGMRIM